MDEKITVIQKNIEDSSLVLRGAWKGHAPEIAKKLKLFGASVRDRYIRYQYEQSKHVKTTNVLKRFKIYLAGSYLTRHASGERIFADLFYFRSLFNNPFWRRESSRDAFLRVDLLGGRINRILIAGKPEEMPELQNLAAQLTEAAIKFQSAVALENAEIEAKKRASSESGVWAKFKSLFKHK